MISPLRGYRILDLSRLLPGPYCTQLLADLGAEVIKVETPGVGDYARMIPAEQGGDATFQVVNRGKKSVALNYRNARGLAAFLRLAQHADVVLEGFRPGAAGRWGLGYEAVRAANPRIVYCSLSGYGQTGPYAERAGHDLNYVALGGLLSLNGAAGGPPIPPGVQIADLAGGMLAAVAILGALLGRERSGEGAYLDVAMLDAVVSWVAPVAGGLFLLSGRAQERGRTSLTGALPCYNVYETADGKYLSVAALEPHFWNAFCNALRQPGWLSRQFDAALRDEIAALFRTQTQSDWLALLAPADVCVEPVNGLSETAHDPQVRRRGLIVEAPETAHPWYGPTFPFAAPAGAHPPALGEHTREVLAAAGFGEDEITLLARAKVIRLPGS